MVNILESFRSFKRSINVKKVFELFPLHLFKSKRIVRVNQILDPAEQQLLVFILTKLTRDVKSLPMEDVEGIATTTKPKMNVLKLAVVQVNI